MKMEVSEKPVVESTLVWHKAEKGSVPRHNRRVLVAVNNNVFLGRVVLRDGQEGWLHCGDPSKPMAKESWLVERLEGTFWAELPTPPEDEDQRLARVLGVAAEDLRSTFRALHSVFVDKYKQAVVEIEDHEDTADSLFDDLDDMEDFEILRYIFRNNTEIGIERVLMDALRVTADTIEAAEKTKSNS